MTKLLLDFDLFAYRSAASAEGDELSVAIGYMDKLLDHCIEELQATTFQGFLSGPTNFRYSLFPEYKANRRNTPKPTHLLGCREYLIEKYDTVVSDGCEADDLMGVAQCAQTAKEPTIIVSLDKDMLQVPGWHYSWHIEGGPRDKRWVKEAKLQEISALEGARHFYTQMLTGDSTDGIKGASGVGKVGAAKMLASSDLTEEDMYNLVSDRYGNDEEMEMNAACLHIWRNMGDVWRLDTHGYSQVPHKM